MAAEAQLVLDLFDSCWFDHQILKKPQNPLPQIHKTEESAAETSQSHEFSAIPTINVRSYSDELLINSANFITDLQTPELKAEENEVNKQPVMEKKRVVRRRRNLVRTKSKSLSELEFEELKGFIDLGFLFSEKDKDSSSLISIIPGLQRLGKEEDAGNYYANDVSRPYLSEAWGDLEKMKLEETPPKLMIRIPVVGNESDMKQQLRFWAHSVASVVR